MNALLDSGSAINLITWETVKTLKLPTKKFNINIITIGRDSMPANYVVQLKIQSCQNNSPWSKVIDFFVVSELPTSLKESFDPSSWSLPTDVFLADPLFNESKPIHVLLGADTFFDTLLPNNRKRVDGKFPTLQETRLGWVIAGHTPLRPAFVNTNCTFLTSDSELSQSIKKFWEVEEATPICPKFSDEALAEAHFASTYDRDHTGRYIVSLPLNLEPSTSGDLKAQILEKPQVSETKIEKVEVTASQCPLITNCVASTPCSSEAINPINLIEEPAILSTCHENSLSADSCDNLLNSNDPANLSCVQPAPLLVNYTDSSICPSLHSVNNDTSQSNLNSFKQLLLCSPMPEQSNSRNVSCVSVNTSNLSSFSDLVTPSNTRGAILLNLSPLLKLGGATLCRPLN